MESSTDVHFVALEFALADAVDGSDQGGVAVLVGNSNLIEVIVILLSFSLVGANSLEPVVASDGRSGDVRITWCCSDILLKDSSHLLLVTLNLAMLFTTSSGGSGMTYVSSFSAISS